MTSRRRGSSKLEFTKENLERLITLDNTGESPVTFEGYQPIYICLWDRDEPLQSSHFNNKSISRVK